VTAARARGQARPIAYPRPAVPHHLALIGACGAGKTTVARELITRGFTHLSIDVIRHDGGDWEDLVRILGQARTPLVIESVGAPVIYRRALPRARALLVHVRCDEAERQRRIRNRPPGLQGTHQPFVRPHVVLDTTNGPTPQLLDHLAGLVLPARQTA